MHERLEIESEELARAFRDAAAGTQRRVAQQLVESALADQEPPLAPPPDAAGQRELAAQLDASDDEADFRRARAATAVVLFSERAYEDALYEALHARVDIAQAVEEALSQTR